MDEGLPDRILPDIAYEGALIGVATALDAFLYKLERDSEEFSLIMQQVRRARFVPLGFGGKGCSPTASASQDSRPCNKRRTAINASLARC